MVWMLISAVFFTALKFLLCGILTIFLSIVTVRFCIRHRRSVRRKYSNAISVGFFHPYCNAGGGGEKVLWYAVRTIQNRNQFANCVIYTGDAASEIEILENVKKRFNIELPRPVEFVYLKHRYLIEPKHYPYFTLLCQSLASIILGLEAAFRHIPDVYIDTMGYAFTYPFFKHICGCTVGAYVHYPTISTDMLSSVSAQKVCVHNREFISKSRLLSNAKLLYYRIFSAFYGLAGRQSNVIMVNSSWTLHHILELWKKPDSTHLVYPPCDTKMFETLPLRSGIHLEDVRIISIAQFRPEKNHKLQLESLKLFLDRAPKRKRSTKLVLIGGCRHDEDYKLVDGLRSLASKLDLEENVVFKINLPFDSVLEEMKNADIALHSMWNEHFGIGNVECMSAGLIMIAHNSGGPKMDIIKDGDTGFLAEDAESYADALECVHRMSDDQLLEMRRNARVSARRFSGENFEIAFRKAAETGFLLSS